MKIVVLGSQGQVGQALQQKLPPLGEVVCLTRSDLDLTQLAEIGPVVAACQPDLIINAAAYTAVDKAETEPELASLINAQVPERLAQVAAEQGAALIHLSTDYVFDGRHNQPYRETDATAPLGVYGRTKQAGEAAAIAACDRAFILRTAWVYSAAPQTKNFVKTMLRLGAERDQLRVVVDQVGSPTWADDIAEAIAALAELTQPGRQEAEPGLYHFTSVGVASWFDFAIAILEEGLSLGLLPALPAVEPIPTSAYPLPAPRPAYSVLATDKLSQLIGRQPPYWRHSLKQMLQVLAAAE